MSQLLSESNGIVCLAHNSPIRKINGFLDSPWFVALVALLTVMANLFGGEMIVYSVFILFAVYIALFGTDFLPLIMVALCCYIVPSVQNNPGRNPNSIFSLQNGGIYLLCLFVLFVISVAIRLVRDPHFGGWKFLKCQRKMMPGMLLLGGAYLLGGIFSGRYWERGIVAPAFALLQFLSIAGLYWFFAGAIQWNRVKQNYFAWVGLALGLIVCCETLAVYLTNDVVTESGYRLGNIYTGWGNKNNMGAIIAMAIPFAMSLTRRETWGWIFQVLTMVLLLFLCFTCSRTSIFFGLVIYGITLSVILKDPKWRKKVLLETGLSFGIFLLLALLLFHGDLTNLIGRFWKWDFASVGDRFDGYQKGLEVFASHPIFGDTFYPRHPIYEWSTVESFKALLPARWHNTILQILASCGLTGLVCYTIHRYQTLRLFWEKRGTEVVFAGLSISCLLLMSLMDCHFFNIGPTLIYSAALAYAEKIKG